ncbi:FxsA family membrane protein [Streptomyces sp. NPDC054884]|uniref:FxsA family membrane protein n=1 Tax=Streptomyces sp. ME08-AFT2 TaxID=3028683 RepID=UPI0029A65995|nr:FxsA family membrane protein [Streptomyces sp. ME08-AFT2]MDX3313213.1 FxsA family protein [Streptomyces sp. ME08-AFT2]
MTTGAPTPVYPTPDRPGRPQPQPQTQPRRSRLRTFVPLGLAAWLVLEIWLLTMVAGASSGLVVLLLLVAGFVLGAVVIKRAGRRAFRNLNEALQRGTAPSRGGNGLMMLGGLLLMIPGLFSDAVGLLLLLPPVQKAVGAYAERRLRVAAAAPAAPGTLGDAFQQARIHRPDGKVVQGEVVRDDR